MSVVAPAQLVSKVMPMFVAEQPAQPSENPLEYTYVFSYFSRPSDKFDPEEYSQVLIIYRLDMFNQLLRCVLLNSFGVAIDTLKDLVNQLDGLDISLKVDVHFFKRGIKPVWEDDANVKGGKWILRVKKGLASRIWENLLLAMVGEQFMVGDEICGAVCSIRNQEDIVSLWNRTASDHGVTNRIRDTLRRVLNLPANAILEYKRHDNCLKDQSSYRHTNVDLSSRRM